MLSQQVRFGNSNNNYEVTGFYAAQRELSVNAFTLVSSFKVITIPMRTIPLRYIATVHNSRIFEPLYFAVPQPNYLTFISERVSYLFSIVQREILPSVAVFSQITLNFHFISSITLLQESFKSGTLFASLFFCTIQIINFFYHSRFSLSLTLFHF